MRNTVDVTGGNLSQIAVHLRCDNPLVAYDIRRRKGEVLFLCFVPVTTRDIVAFPSVTNTCYSKISLVVILSWYFDLPEGVTFIHALLPLFLLRGRDFSGVNADNPLATSTYMGERERCYSFVLSRTSYETSAPLPWSLTRTTVRSLR
jgi:hypothetical protein